MSRDSKSNDGEQKKQQQKTRLQAELGHRYNALTPARRKPKPGAGSLTEDLAEAELEVEQEQAQEQEVAAEGQELQAEAAPKSLFELPRKEPSRPSLLGGGVEVAPATPAGGTQQSPASAPAPFGKSRPK